MFYIFKDVRGEFRFRLRAGNNEIILQSSEGYSSKQGCRGGIAAVKANASLDSRYSKYVTSDSHYAFTLRAGNHEELARSESYPTASARDEGVRDVKRIAPNASTTDLT